MTGRQLPESPVNTRVVTGVTARDPTPCLSVKGHGRMDDCRQPEMSAPRAYQSLTGGRGCTAGMEFGKTALPQSLRPPLHRRERLKNLLAGGVAEAVPIASADRCGRIGPHPDGRSPMWYLDGRAVNNVAAGHQQPRSES